MNPEISLHDYLPTIMFLLHCNQRTPSGAAARCAWPSRIQTPALRQHRRSAAKGSSDQADPRRLTHRRRPEFRSAPTHHSLVELYNSKPEQKSPPPPASPPPPPGWVPPGGAAVWPTPPTFSSAPSRPSPSKPSNPRFPEHHHRYPEPEPRLTRPSRPPSFIPPFLSLL